MSSFALGAFIVCIPFIGSGVFLFFFLFGQYFFDFQEEIEVSIFGIFAFNYVVSGTHFRVLCAFYSALFFLWGILRNYTPFFPRVLEMDVRFDEDQLEEILSEFVTDPRFDFEIYSNWKSRRRDYLSDIERLVLEETGEEFTFDGVVASVGKGTTTFVVQRTRRFLQSYRVVEAHGSVDLVDQSSLTELKSEFVLMDTERSKIEVSLGEMIFNHKFMLKPYFTQIYRINPTIRKSHSYLASVTLVRFFPFVNIGHSIYLLRGERRYTPIAYCSYSY